MNTAVDDVLPENVAVYPNPANTLISVVGLLSPACLTLYTVDGKQVRSAFGSILPVANVADGIYMLHITTTEGTKVSKVLVKH